MKKIKLTGDIRNEPEFFLIWVFFSFGQKSINPTTKKGKKMDDERRRRKKES